MNYAENPFNIGMFLQLKVLFKMGAFSGTQHTHPAIFIFEWGGGGGVMPYTYLYAVVISIYMAIL